MKKLRIITLTAICMMTGVSLLEAKAGNADKHSIQFTNNTANPLSIECKSQYRKVVNGIKRIRHDRDTLTVPAGGSKTWNYHTEVTGDSFVDIRPQYIKIKDTASSKHLELKKGKGILKLAIDGGNNTINADYTITTISSSGTTVTTKINGDGTTTVTSTPKTGIPTVTTKPSSDKDLVLK